MDSGPSDDGSSQRLEEEQQQELDEMKKEKEQNAREVADEKLGIIRRMQGAPSLFNGVNNKSTLG